MGQVPSTQQTSTTPARRSEKTAVSVKPRPADVSPTPRSTPRSSEKKSAYDNTVTAIKTAPSQLKSAYKASKVPSDSSSDPLKLDTDKQIACREWFDRANELGLTDIRNEFVNKLKTFNPNLPTTAFRNEANATKNRYDDVALWDATRIKVLINPQHDDYIHASRVEVREDLVYICTQGPLIHTIEQFWLMCIQEETKVILQLCLNVEDGSEKCAEYLPKEAGEWVTFGSVKVKIAKSAPVPAAKKVTKTIVRCKFDDKEVSFSHISYFGWPDHGIAESVPTCCEVRTLVHKYYEKKPIVVHCSAGIGRTGTFVAVEMVCNKLLNECNGDFSMIELVQDLRKQRAQAIQNSQQYSFIYRAVIEILVAVEGLPKSTEVAHFLRSYEAMAARKKMTRSPKLRTTPSKNSKRVKE